MASFDENGLKIDRLADIYSDISTSLKSSFGDSIDLDERSPIGVIVGIMAERYSLLYELLEGVYNASFPATAYGVYLDYVCALNGIARNPAVASTVDLTFTRSNDASSGQVEIPAGTQVKSDLNDTLVWSADSGGFIAEGETTTTVRATCSETGENAAAVNSLTFMPSIPNNIASVTNLQEASLGSTQETDAELRSRRENSLGKTATPTQVGLTSALLNMGEIASATVVVNDTEITDASGRPPHSFEAYVSPITGQTLGQETDILFASEIAEGDVLTVNVDSTQIDQTTADADISVTLQNVCTILETSPLILSATPNSSTSIEVASATYNAYTIDVVSANGVQITESVVSAPSGLINKVAQTLWNSKSVGISTHGTIKGEATDVDGASRPVYFSTISPIVVYVKYSLTVSSLALYNSDTTDKIKTAVTSFAQIQYTAGIDVLNYQLASLVSDLGLSTQGVITLVVETSLDNINYSTDNIAIGVEEFATIESQNVTVNVSE